MCGTATVHATDSTLDATNFDTDMKARNIILFIFYLQIKWKKIIIKKKQQFTEIYRKIQNQTVGVAHLVRNIILFNIYLFCKITVEYIIALVKEKWGGSGSRKRGKKLGF